MSKIPGTTERPSPSGDSSTTERPSPSGDSSTTERPSPSGDSSTSGSSTDNPPRFDLADMANIFEFAVSRLLAITVIHGEQTSSIIGNAANFQQVPYVGGRCMCIAPPLSNRLRYCVGILGMSSTELLTYRQLYDQFMKLPVEPTGAWARGRVVKSYPLDWWNTPFDTADYETFTSSYPGWRQVGDMVGAHFEQLPESQWLITPAVLVQARSTPVAQQLATIQAGVRQGNEQIVKMLEDKVVEAKLVAASLMRMETALGEDVRGAIAATELLVKYLKGEQN
ncbi:hypothetical protein DEU56DRAFT_758545 [Suillus clintonianus]|uniref:uncharacterized protein n=1 Tax=Suillus clintonianus TaxID=1904413 RepID=UPI001B8667CD|nr:uncharacterized protein DEU56DRAFT_758545 [Suillus clintonianus]KAG2127660.1 hypothetical protein DEU56DRAFT_758545 [Suillus clintonianus]